MFLLAHAVQMAAEAEAAEATATGGANERPIVSRSVKGKWTESPETKGRRDAAAAEEEDRNLHRALNNDKRLTGDVDRRPMHDETTTTT